MAVALVMRFRPPAPEPKIISVPQAGCYALTRWSENFDTALAAVKAVLDDALFFKDYRKLSSGLVEITTYYNPRQLAERMATWGYEVAEKGLGRFFDGYKGVVGFTLAKRIDTGRATKFLRPPV